MRTVSLGLALALLLVACGDDPAPAADAPPAPGAGALAGNPDGGESVYAAHCAGCHQPDGQGMAGVLGADFVHDASRLSKTDAQLLTSIANGVPGTVMPMFVDALSLQERKDVLAYIRREFGGRAGGDDLAEAAGASGMGSPQALALYEPPPEGAVIDPPLLRTKIAKGAWICDMGTVHYARGEEGDGVCAVCAMDLSLNLRQTMKDGPRPDHGPEILSDAIRWTHVPMNTADLPNRSAPEDQSPFEPLAYDRRHGPDTPVSEQVAVILDREHTIRSEPWGTLYSMAQLDYYSRREEVQAEFERQIAEATPERRPKMLDDYAWTMAYQGEFEKVKAWFPAQAEALEDKTSEHYGSVQFAIGQALFRTGLYKESIAYHHKAQDLVHDAPNDTRWAVLVSEMAAFGPDLFENYTNSRYTLEHIPEWYPKKDWELPFEDVTATVGEDMELWGGYGYVHFVDYDADGWDDLFVEGKFFTPRMYRNVDGKRFEKVEGQDYGRGNNVLSHPADFDNDGHLDLFRNCCNYDAWGPLQLFKGGADFAVEEVTEAAGLGPYGKICGMGVAWVDYNLDSYVDLFVANWCGPTLLFHNNGDGTFTEKSKEVGFHTPGDGTPWNVGEGVGGRPELNFGSHGVAGTYMHGSHWPDIYVQGWGWRKLFKNNEDGTFTDVTKGSGEILGGENSKNYWTFTIDMDNDGDEDIMSGSYVVGALEQFGISSTCICSNLLREDGFSEREKEMAATMLRNNGDGTFTDARAQSNFMPLGMMGYTHGDWNNDGFEDVLMGGGGPYLQQAEPFLFYQNNATGDGSYTLMTPFTALSLWGKGHGQAFGDYDHDGQLDLMLNNGGQMPGDSWPNVLLHNTGNDNHWLRIEFEAGEGTNAAAIGAKAIVTAGGTEYHRTMWSGSTFGQNMHAIHLGLGQTDTIDSIEIIWPNAAGTRTTLTGVAVDQAIMVNQASGTHRTLW